MPSRRSSPEQDAASGLPEAFLMCRDLNHLWMALSVTWDGGNRVWVETVRCSRCTAEKDRLITRDGYRVTGRGGYRYPEGYLTSGETNLTTKDGRAAVRLARMTGWTA